jgi:peptidoglycan/xylan/chitin deacetylase (PgdA/CDA1 family)
MKRLIKLFISLLVRLWDVALTAVLRLFGHQPGPACVALYYHAITAAQRARFARQMDLLVRLAKPISADLPALPTSGVRYCAVTFDDGFVSVLENALPELERRNIPATLFVPAGCLGGPPAWVKATSPARHERVLSAEQLAALKDHRLVTIGSHSVSHSNLLHLDLTQARLELEQSKVRLEAILRRKVCLFSFPHGECDARIIALAHAAGYERVFTINPCNAFSSTDNFVQGRVMVDPTDWPLEFRLKVQCAYRWLAKSPYPKSTRGSGFQVHGSRLNAEVASR